MSDVLLQENVNGNLIRIDDEGGVVTKFGNVQETYQLEDKEIQGLMNLFQRYDPRDLLDNIPAPKLIDLSVGMTRGDISLRDFLDIKETFEYESRYMSEYRLMYQGSIRGTEWEVQEPHTDIDVLVSEMDAMKSDLEKRGMDNLQDAESSIGDAVQPVEVQHIDFPKAR